MGWMFGFTSSPCKRGIRGCGPQQAVHTLRGREASLSPLGNRTGFLRLSACGVTTIPAQLSHHTGRTIPLYRHSYSDTAAQLLRHTGRAIPVYRQRYCVIPAELFRYTGRAIPLYQQSYSNIPHNYCAIPVELFRYTGRVIPLYRQSYSAVPAELF